MKKSIYKAIQRGDTIKNPDGTYFGAKGAFGFSLRKADTKLKRPVSPAPGKGRLEGRLGIKPMGVVASMFAGKRKKIL